MKKILIIITLLLINMFVLSQTDNKPIFDEGYYYGMVNDSLKNKFIFIKFLSNDSDSIIFIIPYIFNKRIDVSFVQKKYEKTLKDNNKFKVDGNVLINKNWSIVGFDNYSYFSINDDIVTFSLNIADFENNKIDVFMFYGKVKDNGHKIESIISRSNKIFNENILILNYKKYN